MPKTKIKLAGIITILLFVAAAWGFISGLLIFLLPFGSRASVEVTSSGVEQISVTPAYFFETQGWWGIFILIIFAGLYYGPFHFYRRGSTGMARLFAIVTIVISVLAGFSIGPIYFVGSFALILGILLLLFQGRKRDDGVRK